MKVSTWGSDNMAKRKRKKKIKTSDVTLLALAIFIAAFIISMEVTFWVKNAVPDTLIQYTLGAGGLEALLLAGIKISKVIKKKMGDDLNDME